MQRENPGAGVGSNEYLPGRVAEPFRSIVLLPKFCSVVATNGLGRVV